MSGIIPYPSETTRFDNGLTVITLPMPSPGLASFWSIVRTGSRDEYETGRTGFAHFFEHMMFRGTERYPAERYQHILTELGSDANAYTTDDLTAYHLAATSGDLEQIMDLESDRFRNLAYPEQDFKTEAGAVYGEYRKDKTDPLFVLYEAVRERAFDRHSYGHTTMGYESDIAAMPTMYEYSKSFFARYYRPENTVLLVVGDIEPGSVVSMAERYYGDWQIGYRPPELETEPEQTGEHRIGVSYPGQALPMLWHAYKVGRFDPADRIRVAADLLVELAYGETSDAYRRLVLQDQSVEFLAAYATLNRDPSVLDIYCRVKSADGVAEVETVLDHAAAAFRDSLVGDAELAALKSRLRYQFLMHLETPDATAQALARPIALAGDLAGIEALYGAYESVTAEDIRDAAREIFVPEKRTVGVLRGTS